MDAGQFGSGLHRSFFRQFACLVSDDLKGFFDLLQVRAKTEDADTDCQLTSEQGAGEEELFCFEDLASDAVRWARI
jgi:hypothetical protein